MADILRTKVYHARADYHCDAWPFIDASHEKDKHYRCTQIAKGQLYQLDVLADTGGIAAFRSCLQCRDHAAKYKIKMEENCY